MPAAISGTAWTLRCGTRDQPTSGAVFEFCYNNRENPDIFGAAIRAC